MKRTCLCCQKAFDSDGIGNRICKNCKRLQSGVVQSGIKTISIPPYRKEIEVR